MSCCKNVHFCKSVSFRHHHYDNIMIRFELQLLHYLNIKIIYSIVVWFQCFRIIISDNTNQLRDKNQYFVNVWKNEYKLSTQIIRCVIRLNWFSNIGNICPQISHCCPFVFLTLTICFETKYDWRTRLTLWCLHKCYYIQKMQEGMFVWLFEQERVAM